MGAKFGEFLKKARVAADLKTQKAAADKTRKIGRPISQGQIAQIEKGTISAPDPSILYTLAQAYNIDYMKVVFELVREKYEPDAEWTRAGLGRERWNLCEAALTPFPSLSKRLEVLQLRSKASLVRNVELFDLEAHMLWQKTFPNLRELWIIVPNFLDDKHPDIRATVVQHLENNVHLRYFVPQDAVQERGKFYMLKKTLARLYPKVAERVKEQMIAIALGEEQLRWALTDCVIANPLFPDEAAAHRVIRHELESGVIGVFSMRVMSSELEEHLSLLTPWVLNQIAEEDINKVLEPLEKDLLEE